jgi:hypothetical protein
VKYSLFTLLLLLLLTGCQTEEAQAKHDAMVAKEARHQLLAEIEANRTQKATPLLESMGVHKEASRIIIDTNQTKTFFLSLQNRMREKLQNVSESLKEGKVEEPTLGIEANPQHIEIDLNQTQAFFQHFGEKMERFIQDFDTIAKTLQKGQ